MTAFIIMRKTELFFGIVCIALLLKKEISWSVLSPQMMVLN